MLFRATKIQTEYKAQRCISSCPPPKRLMRPSRCLHTPSLQWQPVPVLGDGGIESFRRDAFLAQKPALMPPGCFHHLPAIQNWFRSSKRHDQGHQLNQSYLVQFADAMVPLECSSISQVGEQDVSFKRSEAPLSLFLRWAESADACSRQRLYLAQASFSDLPAGMRDDLPTPEIVLYAGKGDVYDTNLWLGVAPTYTPLHKDPNPNLFVQLVGRKVVRLLPPEVGREIFSNVQAALGRNASDKFRGDEMMQGEEKKLLENQIWGDDRVNGGSAIFGLEALLNSGEGLFIPKGWWHSIKGVGTGINGSVSECLQYSPSHWGIWSLLISVGQLVVSLMIPLRKLWLSRSKPQASYTSVYITICYRKLWKGKEPQHAAWLPYRASPGSNQSTSDRHEIVTGSWISVPKQRYVHRSYYRPLSLISDSAQRPSMKAKSKSNQDSRSSQSGRTRSIGTGL